MQRVGMTAVHYSVTITHADRHEVGVIPSVHGASPPHRRLPKLAYAAIIAAPPDPSPRDKQLLQAMGYVDGREEVANRIRHYNEHSSREQGLRLPLPYGFHR
jgi:hypothetical protein